MAWRNTFRALRKPNGNIGLVSNLLALNDIVEKEEYRLSNMRDVLEQLKICQNTNNDKFKRKVL